jgi:hypothetical protein
MPYFVPHVCSHFAACMQSNAEQNALTNPTPLEKLALEKAKCAEVPSAEEYSVSMAVKTIISARAQMCG